MGIKMHIFQRLSLLFSKEVAAILSSAEWRTETIYIVGLEQGIFLNLSYLLFSGD